MLFLFKHVNGNKYVKLNQGLWLFQESKSLFGLHEYLEKKKKNNQPPKEIKVIIISTWSPFPLIFLQ